MKLRNKETANCACKATKSQGDVYGRTHTYISTHAWNEVKLIHLFLCTSVCTLCTYVHTHIYVCDNAAQRGDHLRCATSQTLQPLSELQK